MPEEEKSKAAWEDRRWDELKFVQETLYKAWSAFLVYFIFLHTAVYGAIAVLLKGDPKPPRDLVWVTTAVILSAEGLSIAVAIALVSYTQKALRRARAIVKEANFHPGIDPEILLPDQFLKVVGRTCVASFVIGALSCIYMFMREH
jgi:hypothetical protein